MKFGVGQSVEAGAIGAVCDALGICHVDMPVTPQKIFDILHNRHAGKETE